MDNSERSAIGIVALLISIFALALAGLGIAVANNNSDSAGDGGAATAQASLPAEVKLSEFSIAGTLSVATGGALHVTNSGTTAHNLAVKDTSLRTKDLNPGDDQSLDLSALSGGNYTVYCTIAGHEASGMVAALTVESSAHAGHTATNGTDGTTATTMDAAAMARVMDAVALQFPAKTVGIGGDDAALQPTILADGTKEFDLTAKIVDWEVAPGKIVKAWTYNGVVPGPTIRVAVGDRVKIVLTNNLPEATALHFHGVRVPNKYDGVPPYTQPNVMPGESFTAEFTALEPAVGMYHSHLDAQIQIPNGLAGAFLIGEMPVPAALGKVNVVKTVNMVLNDAGTIGLSLNGKSFPATQPYTLKIGESMIVNYLNEGLQIHPMHLHQPKGYVIAKDGVPLTVPMPGDTFNVAPGERVTVLYTATDPGVWAWHCHILTHAETPTGMTGMVTALIVEA